MIELDRIEDARIPHQLVHPRKEQVRLDPLLPLERMPLRALEGFEPRSAGGRLGVAQHRHREMKAALLVCRDLGRRQTFRQAYLPSF